MPLGAQVYLQIMNLSLSESTQYQQLTPFGVSSTEKLAQGRMGHDVLCEQILKRRKKGHSMHRAPFKIYALVFTSLPQTSYGWSCQWWHLLQGNSRYLLADP